MQRPINVKPEHIVPFLEHIGVQTTRFERLDARAELEVADELLNQLGSLHPSLLYSVAECAGGALIAYNFDVSVYTPLIKSVSIRFLAPVVKKAIASAHIDEDTLQSALQQLQDTGRTDIETAVRVQNEAGITAAEINIVWSMRSMAPSAL